MFRRILIVPIVLCLLEGWHATATVLYVDRNSTDPVPPFSSWATAATSLQDAVDAATNGDEILVTNGIYQTGGRPLPGSVLTNRVLVTNAITVRSVNGPATAVISGFPEPGLLTGTNNVRCAYLDGGAQLIGFTLANGVTTFNVWADGPFSDKAGGGVFCASSNEVVSNCVISGNVALLVGGGAYSGTLNNCALAGNWVEAGYGGGAAYSTLNNCVVTSNLAAEGGGTFASVLYNCTVAGNAANDSGGGVYSGYGFTGLLYNCIVFGNSAQTASNYDSNCKLAYCCTFPLPTNGIGNITNAPLFVNPALSDFHLQSNSPCINAGYNAYVTSSTDLDGNSRISGGTVDIGAYEFQNPASIISYAWLQQYGLPTDGSADFIDSDYNGMNNWQKWIAGLDPTNPSSVLKMLHTSPSGTNLVVTWQSVTNITYYLQRATNLATVPAFQPLATNLPGQSGTTSYTDTNAPAPGPYFYRVGVQHP
jgi:hypothetical protein